MQKVRGLRGAGMLFLGLASTSAEAVELRLNAFGDLTFGQDWGDFASPSDRQAFESDGLDPTVKNSLKGFGVAGTDFVLTADIQDNLIYQGEINFQVDRGSSSDFSVDVERMYLDYLISPSFNVMAGLFFTPVGHSNRNLYARAWLMRGIQVHDFFEEEYGFIPTHTTGVNFHGAFDLGGNHSLMYALSAGNGRAIHPDGATYSRDEFAAKEFAALLEWRLPLAQDFRIGLSGWTDEINTIQTSGIGTGVGTGKARLRDIGFNPFVVFESDRIGFLAEYVSSSHKDELGNLGGGTFTMRSFTAEIAYKLMDRRVQPYVRYDKVWLPADGGPYYGIRDADFAAGTGDRKFVPAANAAMLGVAYDVTPANRLKVEYMRSFNGPVRENRLAFQTAFGF